MIKMGPLIVDETLASDTRRVFRSASGVEGAVLLLRKAGEDKLGSIRVLVQACGMTLRDAKRAVHLSAIWADCRDSDDAMHDALIRATIALDEGSVETPQTFQKAS